MKRLTISLFINIILFGIVYGQGIVRGKVTDENGEPLTGVTVAIRALNIIVFTDFDGKFSLKVPVSTPQQLTCSFVGYQNIEDTVLLSRNEVIIIDYNLLPLTQNLNEVVVTGKAKKANDTYMNLLKAKSASSIDFISAETIKRTGDSQTGDAIKRITGVSTIGGFISVRGLADRYIKTSINGMRIPTLDPLTNNIKLDIFPTSLIDNIVITKTASPDLPGDWAGSYVSVETKDYIDKLTVNVSTSIGYNHQTTFHDIVSSKKSKTDWLGYDDGYRDVYQAGYKGKYPEIKGTKNNPMPYYDEFAAIGLTEYMDSAGITRENLKDRNINIYLKLCLIELGLLAPGHIDNPEKVNGAVTTLHNEYYAEAYRIVNTPASEFGQSLPANWGSVRRKAPLSFSQEFSIGNQALFLNRPLGFILGFRYSSSVKYDPSANANITSTPAEKDSIDRRESYIHRSSNFESSSDINAWSALASLAYSLSNNHNITLLYMPNFYGVNLVRQGRTDDLNILRNPGESQELAHKATIGQYYEERKQLIYQYQSNHFFPLLGLRAHLGASYTNGTSSIPDIKSFSMYDKGNYLEYDGIDYLWKRSGYLTENILDTKLAAEIDLDDQPGLVRKLKFGGGYQLNTRFNDLYQFVMKSESSFIITDISEVNDQITKEDFDINSGSFLYYQYHDYSPANFAYGKGEIYAGYLMVDYAFTSSLRFSGGLRLEYTDMLGDLRLYYEKNLAPDDPIRIGTTIPGAGEVKSGQPGILKHYNYLPSVSLIYRLKNTDIYTVNSRFNYSRSIARPSVREITNLYQVDFVLDENILGNPKLKIVEVDNYELRFESFFAKGDNYSLSLFYKKFNNHIELTKSAIITWVNADYAEAYGIELEGMKQLVWNFDLRANLTFIRSESKTGNTKYTTAMSRAMFGQAPYIINAILGYKYDKWGLSANLSYNVQGRKLAIVSASGGEGLEVSDIYEMPQHMVDFKLSKTLGKRFSASFKIRNLLDAPVRRAYDYSRVGEIDFDNYSYGTEYVLGISYNF